MIGLLAVGVTWYNYGIVPGVILLLVIVNIEVAAAKR